MDVIPDSTMSALLTAILLKMGTAVTGLLHLHLFTNDFTPDKDSVLGDFTELTNVEVPGYVEADVNWFAGVPFRRSDGSWESPNSEPDASFIATSAPPAPIVVYGYFLTDSTNAILKGSGRFTSPYTFELIGDGFTMHGNPNLIQPNGSQLVLNLADLQPE